MAAVAFDTLKLARKLRDTAQMSAEQAEGVADALAEAMSGAELATKPDVREMGQTIRGELREIEQALRSDIREIEQTLRSDIREIEQSLRAAMRETDQALRSDMREMDQTLRSDMREMDQSLRSDMREIEQTLRSDMREMVAREQAHFESLNERIERRAAETESRMIRWVVGVGAAGFMAVIGAIMTLIRYLPSH